MADNFEKFIREHRDEFDTRELGADLFDKIKLPENKYERDEKVRKLTFVKGLRWAAIFILVFGAGFFLQQIIKTERPVQVAAEEKIDFEKEIPELQEAKIYYSQLVNNKLKEVEPLLSKDPELEDELLKDLNELDSLYDDMKEDLRENVANQSVIEAMIQNYRIKLDILEEILNEMEENEKSDDHENNNEINL